jgi:ferrochelatase
MKGLLLINLGSPKSSDIKDVKVYLREFLMDKRIIDVPWIFRKIVVELMVLPNRAEKTAGLYSKVWLNDGAPLIVNTKKLRDKLQQQTHIPVAIAMRYQYPSIKEGLQELKDKGVNDVLAIPLYPQHAMSTTETLVAKIKKIHKKHFKSLRIDYLPPFYKEKEYQKILAGSIKGKLPKDFDLLLFSFHGIPEKHIYKTDPYGKCSIGDCCFKENLCSHNFCYRHQCYYTMEQVRQILGLDKSKVMLTFQSRLGHHPWLKPYTDKTLAKLPSVGIKKIVVVAPAFVSDCLETLSELVNEGNRSFIANGGEEFTYIECLNDNDDWILFLKNTVEKHFVVPESSI